MPTKRVSAKVIAQRKARRTSAARAKGSIGLVRSGSIFAEALPAPEPKQSKGQKLLVRAAKRLVESRLNLASLTPVSTSTKMSIKSYENLSLMVGNLSDAEKDLYSCLDLIGDVLVGRPILSEIDYEKICTGDSDLEFNATTEEMMEVINRFNKGYTPGTIRNAGMKPGYDAEALMAQYRRDPDKFRLLKATSGKRFHIVLFGTLYSFGKTKAAAAGKR